MQSRTSNPRRAWLLVVALATVAACGSTTPGVTSGAGGTGEGGAAGGRAGATGGAVSSTGGVAGGATGGVSGAGAGGSAGAAGGRGGGPATGGVSGGGAGGAAGGSAGGSAGGAGAGGQAGGDVATHFTIVLDAAAPNHFGAEHAGTTGYAELVDTTAGKVRVGDIYSTPMTTTGYARWVWKNAAAANHTYTIVIFDDAAAMNATCMAGDAGWVFPVNAGKPITADSTYTFPTGHAPRADSTKCAWFPSGPLTGVVPVPAP